MMQCNTIETMRSKAALEKRNAKAKEHGDVLCLQKCKCGGNKNAVESCAGKCEFKMVSWRSVSPEMQCDEKEEMQMVMHGS